uniref:Cilia- and flagella-associated protein 418 n=1 Tax=Globisporangium ultimum (strain ATCC 200006 / CBS 805.95 / DAOM BR144) TaxID=431595 RepID=K3X2Y2_GLOUD
MDFQDLLDEVEGVMQGTSSRKPSFNTATPSTASFTKATSSSASKSQFSSSRNDIDDLLNMIGNDNEKPAAAVHSRSVTTKDSPSFKVSSSRDEFLVGGKKKCSQVLLDGEHAKRGVNTALSSHSICANLRCNECDFTVVQFLGKKWNASADYMFFRENVPNEAKLRVKMDTAPAYACQCKWLSIDVQTRVDSCRVKWSCAGH